MRLPLLFCCFAALIHPLVGHCEQPAELIEELACGSINWTSGILTVTGLARPQGDDEGRILSSPELSLRAHQQATRYLLDTLTRIKIDDHHSVNDLIKADQSLFARLLKMTHQATVRDQVHLPDGSVRVTLQMQISGAFAQLILPVEIRQVEAIRPMNPVESDGDANLEEYSLQQGADLNPEGYSGLVVDARGLHVRPAMVPFILDEFGRELYGPAFISREYAVQQGTCEYIRNLDDPGGRARVGPHPLIIKGLRAKSKESCDILVSSADAARLKGISAHLGFLKQCRVIIVLD